jgi:alanyl-tRNA synthetase
MLTSKEIRSTFIDFFKDRGHAFVPSVPVVPIGDDSLLFINAGMNQFKDMFLGLSKSEHLRIANSQKCIRVSGKHNDLEEVGLDTYHHTFFEMLGNWSFNDYFKAEAIEWAWDLLTKVYCIDTNKLWITVFAGDKEDESQPDKEAAELWRKLTNISPDKIVFCGKKDNFWEMGATGPCGPCSEISIDLGLDNCNMRNISGHKCQVNGDCERYLEFWNLVFIQFNRQSNGKLVPLPKKHIDTGLGFERITRVLQNKDSNYDTDLFMPIIIAIGDLTGYKYTSKLDSKTDSAFRVIADHIRTLSFAIADGVTLSNEGRGYVMRRILRRAARFGRILDAHEPFVYKLVPAVVDVMGDAFGEIKDRSEHIATVIEAEEASFGRTLDRGIEIFTGTAKRAEKLKDKTITGQDAFGLYDTYGFPLDLTQLMARERGLVVDTDTFEELMAQQRQRARDGQKTSSTKLAVGTALPETNDDKKYRSDCCKSKVIGWIDKGEFITDGVFEDADRLAGLILEETCFYAESGGQVGDAGIIEGDKWRFDVETTEKIADSIVHRGKLVSGKITIGSKATAIVSAGRLATEKNHTATHLLQWALQDVLGKTARQQGSLVCGEYLRFDFTWPKAVTDEQIKQIEDMVNEKISTDVPVACCVMPIDKAKKLGAMALFSEKYGSQVRVVAIGAEDSGQITQAFSREFCGGTHVSSTGQIGGFKITKQESISAGVRRVTAVTGAELINRLISRSDIVDEITALLKTPAEQVTERVAKLLAENKKLAKELKSGAKHGGTDTIAQVKGLLEKAERISGTAVVVGSVSPAPVPQLRAAIDSVKKKAKSAAVVLAVAEGDDKVILLAAMTDDVVAKGVSAGDVIREIAPIVGGGGGGRPQMAQAGGKNPKKIKDAIQKAEELIKIKLSG